MNNDCIEKTIELKASIHRVWQALTQYLEFGDWFGVKLEGPFEPGKTTRGRITYPGYEHLTIDFMTQQIKPESYFSYKWHPYCVDPNIDYSKEEPTLVEFKLEETSYGTRLIVKESGFNKIPPHRYAEAYRMNEGGWEEQMKNIQRHVISQT